MTLLEFARGPLWWIAVAIFAGGSAWRLFAVLSMRSAPDYSEPRSRALASGAWRSIVGRMLPKPEFRDATRVAVANGYAYHLGLAVIAFGYAPHIAFIERVTGLSWPALPAPVVYTAVGFTFVALVAALAGRLTHPVQRLISGFDDYFSWLVVFMPLVTGMAALNAPYGEAAAFAHAPLYAGPVTIHLLSVEFLLVWLPFGKLAHAFLVFVSRGITGAALERKGVHS